MEDIWQYITVCWIHSSTVALPVIVTINFLCHEKELWNNFIKATCAACALRLLSAHQVLEGSETILAELNITQCHTQQIPRPPKNIRYPKQSQFHRLLDKVTQPWDSTCEFDQREARKKVECEVLTVTIITITHSI